MRRTTLLLTAMMTAMVLACGAGLVSVAGRAEAAFPGANGKIAFAYGDIFTMNPNGTDLVDLTRNNRLEQAPVWSPNGKKIAFTKFLKGYHIWVMNADGSAKTRLAKITPEGAQGLTWSPGGGKIAFSRDGDIWIMDSDGSNQRRFTTDPRFEADPAWSPDGTRLAFWRSPDDHCCAAPDIWVKKLDGSRTIRLTRDPQGLASDSAPDWSPDGKKIAFVSTRHGDLESSARIFVMKAFPESDVNRPQRLTGGTWETSDDRPAFSPDGTRIVFEKRDTSGPTKIFTMNSSDGSDKRHIPTPGFENIGNPDWQPLP